MKINFILPFKRMSGGIRVVYIYADYLVKRGHDVCCYLPMVSYPGKDQGFFFRVKASLSNTFKKETWYPCTFPVKVVPRIGNGCIRDADVTVATAWQTAYDVAALSPAKGRKFYFTQDYEVFNGTQEQVEGSYRLGIPMITVSKALQARLHGFSKQVTVIYNGLFEEEYMQGDKRPGKRLTLMTLYHESPHKGTAEALTLSENLRRAGWELRLILFGRRIPEALKNDPLLEAYENPPRETLMDLYRQADIYLFTSHIEAWGLPVMEAMANRCAVIGRPLGALAELYDGKNAVITESPIEMEAAVKALAADPVRLRSVQQAAYATAQTLSWDKAAAAFEKVLQG